MIGSRCEPRLLPSDPHQPSLAARILAECFDMDGGFESCAVRHDSRLDEPPQGNEQRAREGDNPNPAQAAPAVGEALRIPLRQRTRGLKAHPPPSTLDGQRANVIVSGLGEAALIGRVSARIGGGVRPLSAPTSFPFRKARQPKHSIPNSQALLVPIPWSGRSCCTFFIPASSAVGINARRSAANWAMRWGNAWTCSHSWPRR